MTALAVTSVEIVRRVLIDLGLGVLPSAGGAWPIYAHTEPQDGDNIIVVIGTSPEINAHIQIDGDVEQYHGIQILVRSSNDEVGGVKAYAVEAALNAVLNQTVSYSGHTFQVQSAIKRSGFSFLGAEAPVSHRRIFSMNYVVPITQTS